MPQTLNIEQDLPLADVYAAALFDLARAQNALDAVREELEELVRFQTADADFAQFMQSPAIDIDDRERSLEKLFRGQLSEMVLDTLQVLNRHGRAGLLAALLRALVLRIEADRGQIEVTAASAVPLDAAQQQQVQRIAAGLSGKQPVMSFEVDASLIGGLVLQIGDRRFDHSIRRHLAVAREQLLTRTVAGAS